VRIWITCRRMCGRGSRRENDSLSATAWLWWDHTTLRSAPDSKAEKARVVWEADGPILRLCTGSMLP
jgi:hypothetical protein